MPSLRTALVLPLLALLLAAPAARPQEVDAELRLGETFAGRIALPGDVDVLRFAALEGEVLGVRVRADGASTLLPSVELWDVSASPPVPVVPASAPNGKTSLVVWKKLVLPATAVYELRLRGRGDTTGAYRVATKSAPAPQSASRAREQEVPPGESRVLEFLAHPGTVLRAEVRAPRGGSAVPGALTLTHVSEGPLDVAADLLVRPNGPRLVAEGMLPWHGRYTLTVANEGEDGPLSVRMRTGRKGGKHSWIEFDLGGELLLLPDVLYLDEEQLPTPAALLALPELVGRPESVTLCRLVAGGVSPVATLTDDGHLLGADEIQGDEVYSAFLEPSALVPGGHEHFVLVNTRHDEWMRSNTVSLLVTEHLQEDDIGARLAWLSGYQAQIEASAGSDGALEHTLETIRAELAVHSDVADVGRSESGRGLWFVCDDGVPAVLYAPAAGDKQGGGSSRVEAALLAADDDPAPAEDDDAGRILEFAPYRSYLPPAGGSASVPGGKDLSQPGSAAGLVLAAAEGAPPGLPVASHKVRALAVQFWDWGTADDVPAIVELLDATGRFDIAYTQNTAPGEGNVEWFKDLSDWGVVLISSHGDSSFRGLHEPWRGIFGYERDQAEVLVHSDMRATPSRVRTYESDLRKGRLVLWGGSFGVTTRFLQHYSGAFPRSLVYLSSCQGSSSTTLARALLDKGAGAFVGYEGNVAVPFTLENGTRLFLGLLDEKTLGEAFLPDVESDADPARLLSFGAPSLVLGPERLQDGGFESGNLSAAWNLAGDARIVGGLGAESPPQGSRMALLSTGLGFTTVHGTFSQALRLPADATAVSWRWNFLSEEFLESCGSGYQDAFEVRIAPADHPAAFVTLQRLSVDDLCGPPTFTPGGSVYAEPLVAPGGLAFDQGEVWSTGWQETRAALPAELAGQKVILIFSAYDAGDGSHDTAILVDDVVLESATP